MSRPSPPTHSYIGQNRVFEIEKPEPPPLNEDDISRITCDLHACNKFVNSGNANTKSMWLSTTSFPYEWTSHSSGTSTIKEANEQLYKHSLTVWQNKC